MSELSTVNNQITRTVEVIASEIVGIKEAARKTLQSIATSAAVEIGKRLKEAKALVPYGEWGEWLRANVDYSERTAQNLLKLAEESNRGSFEALMDLSYTQAVQLIGLPAAERSELLQENDVTGLSTRELQELVDKYKQEAAQKQQTIDNLLGEGSEFEKAKEAAEERAKDDRFFRERAELEAKEAMDKAARAEKDARDAKKKAETAEKQIQRLEDELQAHRDQQLQMKEPQAPAEVKATVVEVIPPAVQDELEALREKERQRQAADAAAADTMKREGAEFTFRILYDQFTVQYKKLADAIGQMGAENQAKYRAALHKAMEKMLEMLPGEPSQEG